jgi:hypothetical protein
MHISFGYRIFAITAGLVALVMLVVLVMNVRSSIGHASASRDELQELRRSNTGMVSGEILKSTSNVFSSLSDIDKLDLYNAIEYSESIQRAARSTPALTYDELQRNKISSKSENLVRQEVQRARQEHEEIERKLLTQKADDQQKLREEAAVLRYRVEVLERTLQLSQKALPTPEAQGTSKAIVVSALACLVSLTTSVSAIILGWRKERRDTADWKAKQASP